MNNFIVIPARGGSKGIPKKNIRFLNNNPFISYVINTAQKSGNNFHLVVSPVITKFPIFQIIKARKF